MIIEDENENGVFAISLVTTPATGEEYIMQTSSKKVYRARS